MRCYNETQECCEASTKIGDMDGFILATFLPRFINRFFGWKCLTKSERYYCRKCYDKKKGVKK